MKKVHYRPSKKKAPIFFFKNVYADSSRAGLKDHIFTYIFIYIIWHENRLYKKTFNFSNDYWSARTFLMESCPIRCSTAGFGASRWRLPETCPHNESVMKNVSDIPSASKALQLAMTPLSYIGLIKGHYLTGSVLELTLLSQQ